MFLNLAVVKTCFDSYVLYVYSQRPRFCLLYTHRLMDLTQNEHSGHKFKGLN